MKSAANLIKPCSGICGRMLDLSEFTRDASSVDGRDRYCRECRPIRRLISMQLDAPVGNADEDTSRAMTFEEIGAVMGISKQRVQAIEATALRKLRMNTMAMATIRRLFES
jgi:hypothetical protein